MSLDNPAVAYFELKERQRFKWLKKILDLQQVTAYGQFTAKLKLNEMVL